jgi:type IV pilus assembly protein PilC
MITFNYVAKDPSTGQKIKSQVQAEDERSAAKLIKQSGYSPLQITPEGDGIAVLAKFKGKVKTKDKVLFSRQLATLINAGLPLVQSLRNVQSQTQNKNFKIVINEVIADVESGKAFSQALAKHPLVFDSVFINLVAAGETSGTLDASLARLANQQEKDAEIIRKVRGAMVYPGVVLLVMVGVVGFMVLKVLPQVEEVYKGIKGAELPFITTALLKVSEVTRKYWWIELIVFAVLAFLLTKWARTLGGKRYIDRFKMKAWPVGPLFMKMYMARFARTSETLVAAGVPLIQTLEIVGKSVNNVHIESSVFKATEKIKGGKSLSESITGDPNFLELVPNMLRIGEESGSLEEMLGKTADYYEKEVDDQIKTISTIIEPVMMVVLGVVAFGLVAAIMLPIYGLVGQSGFGG